MRLFGKADSGFGRRMVVVAGAAAVVLPLAAVAADATTPASATVSACATRSTGALHLIHPGAGGLRGHCGKGEVAVVWNQVGPQGPQGLPGEPGQQGQPGEQGPGGVSGYQIVTAVADPVLSDSGQGTNAICPTGKVPIGGGFTSNGALEVQLDAPVPFTGGPPTGWGVIVRNPTSVTLPLTVYAICAYAS